MPDGETVADDGPGSQPAASQPLAMSMTMTAMPKAGPWVRMALVAPALPLPISRMSTPLSRPITRLPTTEPRR
jgi:hypothetical protein